MIALVAAATRRIRIGSGGVQSGHRTALSMVEEFGLLDAVTRDASTSASAGRWPAAGAVPDAGPRQASARPRAAARRTGCSSRPALARALANSPRFALSASCSSCRSAAAGYGDLIDDILALLRGTYRSADGLGARSRARRRVEVWVLGSSAGESAAVAGSNGLRFAANYHVSPATVLEAVDAYRAAFVPSAELDRPYVAVSADVVVADDDAARELAPGYGLWVLSIRTGRGRHSFPNPDEARAHRWTDEDRALVADRVETQFVGSPTGGRPAPAACEATDADELVVTTITHEHEDRVRSYGLLADEWSRG